MIIDYLSDPHLNHWIKWIPNQQKWELQTREFSRTLIKDGYGEVLVIAGDFSEWNCQTLWFLDEVAKHYERVYFTYGNHDLYILSKSQKKKYKDSLGRLNEFITEASKIDSVIPLIKTVDEYKGVVFAGDVMWYSLSSYEDLSFYNEVSNDSVYIEINGCTSEEVCSKLNKESLDWYVTLENKHIDVFVSHVPPLHTPLSKHKPNGCYMVDIPFINAKHWICGHSHNQGEFEKAGVKFYMNSIGYPSENLELRLRSFEI